MCPLLLIVEHERPGGRLDGLRSRAKRVRPRSPRLSVRDPATYGSPARMPRPRHGHIPNSSDGLYATGGSYPPGAVMSCWLLRRTIPLRLSCDYLLREFRFGIVSIAFVGSRYL